MKFSTIFLTCLLASTVFSYTLDKRDDFTDNFKESQGDMDKQIEQMKEEMGDLPTSNSPKLPASAGSLSNSTTTSTDSSTTSNNNSFGQLQNSDVFNEECQKVIAEYYSCLPKIKDKNYDECCNIYNSEKCVNIFKKKLSENDACKNGTEHEEKLITLMAGIMDMSCAKHNGNYCPLSKLNKEGKEITQSAIDETCKYHECLQKGISGLEASKQWVQIYTIGDFSHLKRDNTTPHEAIGIIDGYINELKSDKCSTQASGTIQLKVGNLFVLSLVLFIYYLL